MKKLLLSALTAMACVFGLTAQAQLDLACTNYYVSAAGTTVPPGHNSNVTFVVENTGANPIPSGTGVVISVFRSATLMVGPDTLYFNGALNAGDSASGSVGPLTFDASIPSQNICVTAYLVGGETDSTNNQKCRLYSVSSTVESDLACDELTIDDPTDLDNFDIDNGDNTVPNIEEMTLKIKNTGDVSFVNETINFVISLDGTDLNAVATLSIASGDSLDLTINNAAVIPTSPQEEGYYEACVAIVAFDDNINNDTACAGFTIIDTYIPPPPIGIEELNNNFAMYTLGNKLVLEGVADDMYLVMSDVQGRQVADYTIIEDKTIDLGHLPSGVYVVSSRNTATGDMETQKFVIH